MDNVELLKVFVASGIAYAGFSLLYSAVSRTAAIEDMKIKGVHQTPTLIEVFNVGTGAVGIFALYTSFRTLASIRD